MARNLFILGAGASVSTGIPVMNGFIEHAEDLLEQNRQLEKKFRAALDFRNELRRAQSRTKIDLNNIETVFGALEMAGLVKSLGTKTPDEIEGIRKSFISIIAETVQYSAKFITKPNSPIPVPPSDYSRFAKMLEAKRKPYSIISFNYDITLDYAFEYIGKRIHYGIEEKSAANTEVKMYKLHGSVNWHIQNHRILAHHFNESFVGTSDLSIFQKKKGRVILSTLEKFEQPVIIPPSWNKAQYHDQLSIVWHKAASELHDARNIIIIGFSLPETDSFFRFLLSIGTIDNSALRKIVVINLDPNVEGRFKALLGQDTEDRFTMIVKKFEDSLDDLKDLID